MELFIPPLVPEQRATLCLPRRIRHWVEAVSQQAVSVTHGGCLRSSFYLYGGMSENDAVNIPIPQDRVLCFEHGTLTWL